MMMLRCVRVRFAAGSSIIDRRASPPIGLRAPHLTSHACRLRCTSIPVSRNFLRSQQTCLFKLENLHKASSSWIESRSHCTRSCWGSHSAIGNALIESLCSFILPPIYYQQIPVNKPVQLLCVIPLWPLFRLYSNYCRKSERLVPNTLAYFSCWLKTGGSCWSWSSRCGNETNVWSRLIVVNRHHAVQSTQVVFKS